MSGTAPPGCTLYLDELRPRGVEEGCFLLVEGKVVSYPLTTYSVSHVNYASQLIDWKMYLVKELAFSERDKKRNSESRRRGLLQPMYSRNDASFFRS